MKLHRIRAFTLVEMSIVLSIIALLIAVVTNANQMIKQSKVQSTIVKMKKYAEAYHSFKLQYDAYPGDMSNASTYWSATQNGDGDKKIEKVCSGGPNNIESFLGLKHLSLAKLIKGSFTGLGVTSGSENEKTVIGTNVDAFPLDGTAATIYFIEDFTHYSGASTVNINKHILMVGGPHSQCSTTDTKKIIPEDAYAIDKKLDDTVPSTGIIMAGATAHDCAESNGSGGSRYNLDNIGQECAVFYHLD